MLKSTPFQPCTGPLVRAQTWRRWNGYEVASSYDPHPDREYAAVRNGAALFDVSPLCKYLITGPDAARLLDRMVTRDVSRCGVLQVLYTPWCDIHGKVIDDGTISRLDDQTYRLTSAEPQLRWLTMSAVGMDVNIDDTSECTGALALQGPLSRAILQALSPDDVAGLQYFRLMHTTVGGVPVTISRTGYTGDLGYELWAEEDHAVALWDALMKTGAHYGIVPAGIWALDIARIEAGLVMADVDYHSAHRAHIEAQKSSPLELNLGWTVSARKGPFTGRAALAAERERGPEWSFVGISVNWESMEALYHRHGLPPQLPAVAWRTSTPIYQDGDQIGYASSGCWSPLLKEYLALAHLRAPYFEPGTRVQIEITVEHERRQAAGVVRKLPFYDPERKRA